MPGYLGPTAALVIAAAVIGYSPRGRGWCPSWGFPVVRVLIGSAQRTAAPLTTSTTIGPGPGLRPLVRGVPYSSRPAQTDSREGLRTRGRVRRTRGCGMGVGSSVQALFSQGRSPPWHAMNPPSSWGDVARRLGQAASTWCHGGGRTTVSRAVSRRSLVAAPAVVSRRFQADHCSSPFSTDVAEVSSSSPLRGSTQLTPRLRLRSSLLDGYQDSGRSGRVAGRVRACRPGDDGHRPFHATDRQRCHAAGDGRQRSSSISSVSRSRRTSLTTSSSMRPSSRARRKTVRSTSSIARRSRR